jgi:hypothetical protein
VDLHWRLRNCPGYQIDSRALWESRVPYVFGERRFFTLSDDYIVTLLSLSIVHDLERGCCKLKQLLDLYLVARDVDARFDWDGFASRREAERLTALCLTGLAVTLLAFDCAASMPRLASMLDRHRAEIGVVDRDQVFDLLSRAQGDVDAKVWFLGVYPGSPLEYRAWLAYHQFPGILLRVRPDWVLKVPRLALGALRRRHAQRADSRR